MASDIDRRQFTETFLAGAARDPVVALETVQRRITGRQARRLAVILDDQLRAGIDIVSDGEQTRQHFVTTFIEHLSGVDFAKREIVKIRNRYEASVPTVVGAVERQKPVFVEDARYLRQLTSQPIKWALPGPMTMIDTLYDNHYKSREKLAWEFAKILNQEAKELEAAGLILFSSMSRPLTSSSMRSTTGDRRLRTSHRRAEV